MTGDEFLAMPYGPVASGTDDLAEMSDFLGDEVRNYGAQFIRPVEHPSFESRAAPDLMVFSSRLEKIHVRDRARPETVVGISPAEYAAATGLAGAWLLNQFAGFRLVVFYVGQMPSVEARQKMGFHEQPRGENVWLVVPNDEGVFHGAVEREGIRGVHPVQAYLDLKDHSERSAEAAEQLRKKLLSKGGHA